MDDGNVRHTGTTRYAKHDDGGCKQNVKTAEYICTAVIMIIVYLIVMLR